MFKFRKINWKKSLNLSYFFLFVVYIFFLKSLIFWGLNPNNLVLAIIFLVCLGLLSLSMLSVIISGSAYLNSEAHTRLTADKVFTNKYQIENILFPNSHFYEENLRIQSCLEREIKRFESFRNDSLYIALIAFVYVCSMISVSFGIFGFYLSKNTNNAFTDFTTIVTFFTPVAAFIFSRTSKIEKLYRDLLEKYKSSINREQ